MALLPSKPSPHRCIILRVSQLLSRSDVDEILYLSEDFIPQSEVEQISSGVDLMRCLERYGRLAPGKYNYLLACLKEVNRLDLAKNLTEFLYSYLLESLPPGFRLYGQAYATKLHILMNKKTRYIESMRNLQIATGNVHFWEEWITSFCCRLMSCTSKGGSTLPLKGDSSELLHLILDDLSKLGVPWLAAVDDFLHGTRVERKLQDIQSKWCNNLELRGARLNEILSTKRPQHLDQAVSRASSSLCDLLSELLGKADEERVERLLKSLSAIKCITPDSHGSDTLTQLLFSVTKIIVSSSTQRHSYEPLLKSLLYQFKNVIFHNKGRLLQVFRGTKLADQFCETKVQKSESIHDENNFSAQGACLPPMDASPLLITVLVCLLTLHSASELTYITWQKIETQLFEHFKLQQPNVGTLKYLMSQMYEALQCELDNFRDTSLTELVKDSHLQYLIASLLHY